MSEQHDPFVGRRVGLRPDGPRPLISTKVADGGPARVWDEPRPLFSGKLADSDPLRAELREFEARVRELEERLRKVEERSA